MSMTVSTDTIITKITAKIAFIHGLQDNTKIDKGLEHYIKTTTYIKNSHVKCVTKARVTFLQIFIVDAVNQ